MSKSDKSTATQGSDPRLSEALVVFKRGDYVRARALLEPLAADTSRPDGERASAQRLLAATRLDVIIPKTALACAGLLGLVALITSVFMP